jgi:hypothetical protein
MVIGSKSTIEEIIDPISLVPAKYRKLAYIMMTEAVA